MGDVKVIWDYRRGPLHLYVDDAGGRIYGLEFVWRKIHIGMMWY